jgi:peptide/nickel transport system substrate-binding protein
MAMLRLSPIDRPNPALNGAKIPLLQSVLTVVHKKNLAFKKYRNGWLLAQTLQWS